MNAIQNTECLFLGNFSGGFDEAREQFVLFLEELVQLHMGPHLLGDGPLLPDSGLDLVGVHVGGVLPPGLKLQNILEEIFTHDAVLP